MKAKKPAAVKAGKPSVARTKLEKELREAIHEVDEEGLLFLLRQAQVLIHNARVESLNREARKGDGDADSPAAAAAPRRRSTAVSIEEQEDGKAIFLNIGDARKVLNTEEMRRIVRICYAAETKSEALRQLFTVLAKERKDILADAFIGNPDNPLLETLFNTVRATYRLKER
ncbi:MAG: hypothetical protein ABSG63_08180 [Spirochaetia bacterium]